MLKDGRDGVDTLHLFLPGEVLQDHSDLSCHALYGDAAVLPEAPHNLPTSSRAHGLQYAQHHGRGGRYNRNAQHP